MKWLRNTGWGLMVFGAICVSSSTLFGWGDEGTVVVFDIAAADVVSVRAGGACYVDNSATNCPAYTGATGYCSAIACDASHTCPAGRFGYGGHKPNYKGQCPNAGVGATGKDTCASAGGYCNWERLCKDQAGQCDYDLGSGTWVCANGAISGTTPISDYSITGTACVGAGMGE